MALSQYDTAQQFVRQTTERSLGEYREDKTKGTKWYGIMSDGRRTCGQKNMGNIIKYKIYMKRTEHGQEQSARARNMFGGVTSFPTALMQTCGDSRRFGVASWQLHQSASFQSRFEGPFPWRPLITPHISSTPPSMNTRPHFPQLLFSAESGRIFVIVSSFIPP